MLVLRCGVSLLVIFLYYKVLKLSSLVGSEYVLAHIICHLRKSLYTFFFLSCLETIEK